MKLFCTDHFKTTLLKLAKIPRHYHCVHKRIKADFLDADSYQAIMGSVLKDNSDNILYKARSKSCGTNGKSYGFRTYILCKKAKPEAYCMTIYPKYGSKNTESISSTDEKERMRELVDEKKKGTLWEIQWDEVTQKLDFIKFKR